MLQHRLVIDKLVTKVNIGTHQEERRLQQIITWYIKFEWAHAPKACITDNLNDTICYKEICQKVYDICNVKHYTLLEHLCFSVFKNLNDKYGNLVKIHLTATKTPKDFSGTATSFSIG